MLYDDNKIDWGWFGNNTRREYPHIIINDQNNYLQELSKLSYALGTIPLDGEITREQYLNFLRVVLAIRGVGQASATRLLAMKRPDCFFALNNGNNRKLFAILEIPFFKLDAEHAESYWDQIIAPIQESTWYTSKEPQTNNTDEATTWRCRMAMMDAIFYEPKYD